ncbi:MAG: hypothetical protein M1837_004053 [Sclerophora amabilis]|nr:MAG: hypothetical protein M1837_004053 [Sclerophora amabilis]
MASTLSPPPGGDVDKSPLLKAVLWTEASIAVLVMGVRLYARTTHVRAFASDDAVMIITLVLSLVGTALTTVAMQHGLGRHMFYLEPNDVSSASKFEWISHAFAIASVVTGKLSVTIFLLRISNTKLRKWLLYTLNAIMVLLYIPLIVMTYAQCTPTSMLWDITAKGTCWNPNIQATYALVCGVYGTFADVALGLYPISIIHRLNMALKTKIGLAIVMGLGVLAGACSAVKTRYLTLLTARSDVTFDQTNLIIWYTTEMYAIIIAGSIPALSALMKQPFGGSSRGKNTGSAYDSHRMGRYPSRKKYAHGDSEQLSSSHTGSAKPYLDTDSIRDILPSDEIRKTTDIRVHYEGEQDANTDYRDGRVPPSGIGVVIPERESEKGSEKDGEREKWGAV